MKKTASIIIVFALVALLFSSCVQDTFETDGYIFVDGAEITPEYMMKIASQEVSFAEFRYYYLNQKAELDGGDDNVWSDYPEYIDMLEEYTVDTLKEIYAIRSLASENQVEPDYDKVKDEIKEYKDGLSSAEYKEGLSQYHLTESLYEYILQGYELYNTLFEYYFGENGTLAMTDEEMSQYLGANYTHAKHILINPNTTMSDSEYQELLDTVASKAREAANTDDFDALIAQYSNDASMPEYGYYFTDAEMPEEFVQACDLLEDYEVSELVKTSHGYHIILKLPVEADDIDELKDVVYNEMFTEIVNTRIEEIQVEYAPEYEYVSPLSVK